MIVKFVFYPKSPTAKVRELVKETTWYEFVYVGDDCARFVIHGHADVNVECCFVRVYIMNDFGKTIDSYHWDKVNGKIKRK